VRVLVFTLLVLLMFMATTLNDFPSCC